MLSAISVLGASLLVVTHPRQPSPRRLWWYWFFTRSAVLAFVGFGILVIIGLLSLVSTVAQDISATYSLVLLDGLVLIFWVHTWARSYAERRQR